MPKRWSNRSISSAFEQAMVFCADFAAVCKSDGDMLNYYRWKMVMTEARRSALPSFFLPVKVRPSVLPKGNTLAQLPLM